MELGLAQSLAFLGPELALGAAAIAVLLLPRTHGAISLAGAALSALLVSGLQGWGEVWLWQRLLVVDGLALFAKLVVALAVFTALWIERDARGPARILLAGVACDLAASAANVWVGAAAIDVACFASAHTRRSSAVVTIAMIASLGWLSGLAGSADFEHLRAGLFEVAPSHRFAISALATIGLGAIVARFILATDGVLAAVALPAALFALLARLFLGALSEPAEAGRWVGPADIDWRPSLALVAAVMMSSGGVFALRTSSRDRLLGVSAIVNLGHALAALSITSIDGLRAALFFLVASTVPMVAASLDAMFSLGTRLLLAAAIGVAGRPLVLATVLAAGAPALAGLVVLSTAAIVLAHVRGTVPTPSRPALDDLCLLGLLGAAAIAVVFTPEPLVRFASRSAHLLPF